MQGEAGVNSESVFQGDQEEKEAISAAAVEIGKARKRAAFSVGLNLLLAIGKGIAGVISGSSALLGDAIHSGTDVIASAAALGGLWLAGRQHPSFPYGLYKAETIATLVTSLAIVLAGYEIARRAILGHVRLPEVSIALPVALISLAIAVAFGLYQLREGRRLHSPALIADARDYLADGMSTGLVVISLIFATFGINVDRWAAGLVAVFVFWSGGRLLWRGVMDLMDEAIDRETERQIVDLVNSHPRVEKVERCLSRTAGGRFIVDLDVVLRAHSHELADRISHTLEADIRHRFPRVVMSRVRAHSRQPESIRRFTPVKAPGGDIEMHIAKAPWFLFETIDRNTKEVTNQEFLKNPYWQEEHKRGFLVGKWLLGLKPDQIVLGREKEGTAVALLKEGGVETVFASSATKGAEA